MYVCMFSVQILTRVSITAKLGWYKYFQKHKGEKSII